MNRSLLQVIFLCLVFGSMSSLSLHAQCVMSCVKNSQVSIDQNCEAVLEAGTVLVGTNISCPGDDKVVTIFNTNGVPIGNTVNSANIGQSLNFMVIDIPSGNSCWGVIHVEDKLAPVIDCNDLLVACNEAIPSATVTAVDNCGGMVTLDYTESVSNPDCDVVAATITRNWTATDVSGNTSTCEQTIEFEHGSLDDVVFPPNYDNIDEPSLSCASALTNPSDTGEPTIEGRPIGDYCELNRTYTDTTIPLCENSYKILRTWTVYDWCNNTSSSHLQVIKIEDKTAPTMNCPASMVTNTHTGDCLADIVLPAASISDDCSATSSIDVVVTVGSKTLHTNGGTLEDMPLGLHEVTFTATDDCGNSKSCITNVTVEDQVQPIAVCDEHTSVSLTIDGTAFAPASTFDDGSVDNCQVDYFAVRRMANDCYPASLFSDRVTFDCCDIDKTVMVVFRVYDVAGNYNECMVDVRVVDKIPPQITCPSNTQINCDEDVLDLSITGEATATDNCGTPVIDYTDSDRRNDCGIGTVTRRFKATDDMGQFTTCRQIITVINNQPFGIDDITWPEDYTTYECGAVTHPDSLPAPYNRPVLDKDQCDLIATQYEDKVLYVNDPNCFKVLRTWTIIDWCNYDVNNSNNGARWTYVQVLKVLDNTAPVFTICQADTTIANLSADCTSTQVNFASVSADDCNNNLAYRYDVDLDNDGSVDRRRTGSAASGQYPNGVHRIIYYAEDGCGNISSCYFYLTVEDKKPPTAICLNGLAVDLMPMNGGGMIQLKPEHFDEGSFDNCTAVEDLDIQLTPFEFTCDDLGQNTVTLTVTDEAGNEGKCITYVIIQDNNNVCSSPSQTIALGGNIADMNHVGVQNAQIVLNNQITMMSSVTGQYQFSGLPINQNQTITASKTDDSRNGVTTKDLLSIAKHLMGVEPLATPEQLISADVNNDGRISASDLSEIRRVILHMQDEFREVDSWMFIDGNYHFPQGSNPLAQAIPTAISLTQVGKNANGLNFNGIKMGDVNHSAAANDNVLTSRTMDALTLEVSDTWLTPGETYRIPVQTSTTIEGGQFTFTFNENLVRDIYLDGDVLNDATVFYGKADHGIMTASWNETNTTNDIFYINIEVARAARLSTIINITSDFTPAEVYTEDGLTKTPKLVFNSTEIVNEVPYTIQTVRPNPFQNQTQVDIFSSVAGEMATDWSIVSATGQVIWKATTTLSEGVNTIVINRDMIQLPGVYYMAITTPTGEERQKIILLP